MRILTATERSFFTRALLVAAGLSLGMGGAGGANESENVNPAPRLEERLVNEEAKLELLTERLNGLKRELESLDRKQTGLLGDLHRLDVQIRVSREQLELLKLQLERGYRQIDANLKKIQALEASIAALRPYLRRRSVSLYKLGRLSYVRLLLSVEEPRDLTRAYRYISRLARADAEKMGRFLWVQGELEATKAELAAQHETALVTREQLEQTTETLERRRSNRKALLASVEQRREMAESLMKEVEEAARNLGALIARLEAGEASATESVAVPIRLYRGELGWPVAGRIEAHFGKRRHPRFRTITVSNGIEIQAEPGTPVRAVYDGEVVFAAWFQGYGNLLILRHPHKVYTLYGHLADFGVAEGDRVREGQEIGSVGETGSLSGPQLYFEVREEGKPVDPEDWLGKRSRLAQAPGEPSRRAEIY